MITVQEAKLLAKSLAHAAELSHSAVLEAAAHAAGYRDWNTFAALAERSDAVDRQQAIPVLRVFDHALARDFYCDFLGFEWVWQQQHEPGLPVYAQVEREGTVLHLTEHHEDATPGSAVMVVVPDLAAYHSQLLEQEHGRARPGVEDQPWGATMRVVDPFGNRLVFWQRSR